MHNSGWFLCRERLITVPSFVALLIWEVGQGHYLLNALVHISIRPRCQLFLCQRIFKLIVLRRRPQVLFFSQETCWGGSQLSLPLRQIARNKILSPLVAVPESPCSFPFRKYPSENTQQDLFSLFYRSLSCRRRFLDKAEGVIVGGEFVLRTSFWKRCLSHSPAIFFGEQSALVYVTSLMLMQHV